MHGENTRNQSGEALHPARRSLRVSHAVKGPLYLIFREHLRIRSWSASMERWFLFISFASREGSSSRTKTLYNSSRLEENRKLKPQPNWFVFAMAPWIVRGKARVIIADQARPARHPKLPSTCLELLFQGYLRYLLASRHCECPVKRSLGLCKNDMLYE